MLEICDNTNELLIWACESRNSDKIMVIVADNFFCSNINDMFNDKAWESAKYFNAGDYDKAVDYTYNVIKKQFNKSFMEEYNTKFKMHKCLADLQEITLNSNDLDYEDYYDLATFEDVEKLYFCDLIISEGKLGLRYSRYCNKYLDEYENISFEEWKPDLTSNKSLMLGMQERLNIFLEKELDYNLDIDISI